MKLIWKKGLYVCSLMVCFLLAGNVARAESEATIKKGVFVDGMDMAGKTREEALETIEAYVDRLEAVKITLTAAGGNLVPFTGEDIGMKWINPEVLDEALSMGSEGNVIERYKTIKDLENGSVNLKLVFDYDMQAINDLLATEAAKYDREAIDFSLKKVGQKFEIAEGTRGYRLDMETSIDIVYDFLTTRWDYTPSILSLDVEILTPRGSVEELEQVKDVLGTYTTTFSLGNTSRVTNVTNGCRLINGVTLYPGDEFSAFDRVLPFTEKNGYAMAGSYLNGKVVDSLGGGICQVTTTLYNAVLLAELEITERYNHSMIVSYVPPANDAAIAESANKNFRFVNTWDTPVYIEGVVNHNKITFTVYGKETRPANRKVTYESEVLEVINPTSDNIRADASKPLGYIATEESAHIGYKAKLWKVVTENGVEVSRTQVNYSKYKMTPRSAVVGVATADPAAQAEIMAAIGTGSIDHVRNVINLLMVQAQHVSISDI